MNIVSIDYIKDNQNIVYFKWTKDIRHHNKFMKPYTYAANKH